MVLEASVTTEGYLSIAMVGETGEFCPLGFRYTTVALLPGVFFHMSMTVLSKNSLQGLGFKCIEVTPLLLKSRDKSSTRSFLKCCMF